MQLGLPSEVFFLWIQNGKKVTRMRNHLNVVQVRMQFSILVIKLSPDTTTDLLQNYVKSSFDKDVEVTQLQRMFPTYATFVINCNYVAKNVLVSPESWEEGVLIRKYQGKPPNNYD